MFISKVYQELGYSTNIYLNLNHLLVRPQLYHHLRLNIIRRKKQLRYIKKSNNIKSRQKTFQSDPVVNIQLEKVLGSHFIYSKVIKMTANSPVCCNDFYTVVQQSWLNVICVITLYNTAMDTHTYYIGGGYAQYILFSSDMIMHSFSTKCNPGCARVAKVILKLSYFRIVYIHTRNCLGLKCKAQHSKLCSYFKC